MKTLKMLYYMQVKIPKTPPTRLSPSPTKYSHSQKEVISWVARLKFSEVEVMDFYNPFFFFPVCHDCKIGKNTYCGIGGPWHLVWALLWADHLDCLNIHFCNYKMIISRISSNTNNLRFQGENSLIQIS